jgi:hypothetical protein
MNVQLHAYWRGPAELVVEYPARASSPRLEGFVVLGADTVWVTPRPLRDMELNGSDAPTCFPYRDGWPQRRRALRRQGVEDGLHVVPPGA